MLGRLRQNARHIATYRPMNADMNTFHLPGSYATVHIPDSISLDNSDLLEFPAFKTWLKTLQHSLSLQHSQTDHPFHKSPYALRSIEVQAVDRFAKGRLGFVKMKVQVENEEKEHFPGSVFLRGGSVAMLVILQPDDVEKNTETDKHCILTLQPRIPAGSLAMCELPAGMLDDSGTFAGAAAKEIEEEIGLKIPQDDLLDLTALAVSAIPSDKQKEEEKLQEAVYTSPGGQDEFIAIFLHQRRVPRGQLKEWTGKLTGLRDHGEKITLKLVRLEDLWKEGARDAKTLAAWALYEGLRREGKI